MDTCVCCGDSKELDRYGFCLACDYIISAEAKHGFAKLANYLAQWANFEEWEHQHGH